MHAKPLYINDPASDLSRSKIYVESLIVLQAKALAYYFMVTGTDVIWTTKVKTAATDGVYVYINPDFFRGLANPSQRAFLLAHEAGHIVLKHMVRGRFFKKRGFVSMVGSIAISYSHKAYNRAADYVINADLIAHGLEAFPTCLLRDDFTRDDLTENVYMTLYAENQKKKEEQEKQAEQDQDDNTDESDTSDDSDQPEPADAAPEDDGDEGSPEQGDDEESAEEGAESPEEGDEGEGEGAGGSSFDDDVPDMDEPDAGGSGGDPFDDVIGDDGHDEHLEPDYDGETEEERAEQAKEDADEIERRVDDAIDNRNDAEERGEYQPAPSSGFELGGNRFGIGDASGTDWRTELAEYVTKAGEHGAANWARIHRRRYSMLGTLTPTRIGTFDRMIFTVDISYSVNRDALNQAMVELAALLDELQPASGCLVLFTNTAVVDTAEVFSGGELLDLEVPCGGGTTMGAAADFCEANGIEGDIHLCFTDGEMSEADMRHCADNGMILILDRVPCSWVQRPLTASGITYITACD